jgi:hypothetical protein
MTIEQRQLLHEHGPCRSARENRNEKSDDF